MLLVTDNLSKQYGDFRALDALSLQIPAGEVFGLLGPNGSGKSTTIRLLLGMIRPTRGSARIDGRDCWSDSVAVRRLVAYLPGELRLYDNLTGRQFLQFLAGLRGGNYGSDMTRLARRYDIDLDRAIANLSSGMKRKLALMSVMLPRVPLVILDEPTNTLDPTMRDELLDQLLEARSRGQTVLFSSHVLQEVERVCDRVGILARGRLVHLQPLAALRQGRQARVHLGAAPTRLPPPGIIVEEHHGSHWRLSCHDQVHELLAWLAEQQVVDLRIEPLGLENIYQAHHPAAAKEALAS
ncbi:MAG TPA: ABC transporter ATP-binding protein [Gemmatales bacterium]|nr:ABC transporter ATP-binding protein [Gemmatales bacterium]HMP60374.1 ABC transporter ATP-binding protein [Gemmatales bacterium]